MVEYWYRVIDQAYSAGADEWGDPLPGGPVRPNLHSVKVIRKTPCGAWVEDHFGESRFVNLNWNKRYALPTVEEAIESFRARKRRQIRLAQSTIRQAEEALSYLDRKGFYLDDRKSAPWAASI